MASFINTNIASLNAQRNLATSQSSLATSLQRLSSGLRINSAKDDAAGLAIADRLTSQINGSTQAARNANDGISLAQTAEGDLNQVTSNLQRIRELAVQSANASNSAGDRASLQNEVSQLRSEIDRVAANSSFNGVKLLDGSFTNQTFQVGANNTANDRITISSIASARIAALGASFSASTTSTAVTATAFASGDLTINGVVVGASASDGVSSASAAGSALAKANAINAASTGVTAVANVNVKTGGAPAAGALASGDLTINGVNVGAVLAGTNPVTQGANVAAAIQAQSAATGVTATADATTGALTLTAADGRNIAVGGTPNGASASGLTAGTYAGTITLSSTQANGFSIAGTGPGITNSGLTSGPVAATATGTAVSAIDVSTAAGAQTALASIDSALTSVNSSRAALGAYQNRFSSAVASLQTTTENLSASRSRIQDADFAAETASLTRGQILQQAGTAILAQANSLPNGVLSLLR